jgi:hypothetical protein
MGGRWLTSREALQRFGNTLTGDLQCEKQVPPPTTKQRRNETERATRQLERLGI